MDALKLEQRAVDEVQPLIYDLSDRLNKVNKRSAHTGAFLRVNRYEVIESRWRGGNQEVCIATRLER